MDFAKFVKHWQLEMGPTKTKAVSSLMPMNLHLVFLIGHRLTKPIAKFCCLSCSWN